MLAAELIDSSRKGMSLSANALKTIAIIAMTIDHLAWFFLPGYRTDMLTLSLHIIGRLTAPIMMYFIVEGFYRTRNLRKYISRLLILAVPSHFAYALMFDKSFIPFQHTFFDQTSVIWAFVCGLVALAAAKSENQRLKPWHKTALVWVCMIAAFCADWSTPAALAILYMGQNRGNFKKQMICLTLCIGMYAVVYAIFLNFAYGLIQLCVMLAIPLLYRYNGERGKWKGMKWFFYIYYPAHLAILGLIRICM